MLSIFLYINGRQNELFIVALVNPVDKSQMNKSKVNKTFSEIGELISAIGTTWFGNTLPAVLYCAFDFDYFLLARYTKGQPMHIIRSDFRDIEMQQTLHYLVTETYVAEPIYRLFNANKTQGGIFNMADLTRKSLSLPTPVDYDLPHLIVDKDEEIGWRTVGWPEYQQETCILTPLTNGELIAVSLFTIGMSAVGTSNLGKLEPIFPIIENSIARHYDVLEYISNKFSFKHADVNKTISQEEVKAFFSHQFSVLVTPREAEIFSQLLQGNTLSAIAEALCISVYTASTHRRNVYRKIGHGRLLELINQFHSQVHS